MFKIADGREYFYQWDLDRQIIVEDSSIVEVHFCNRTDECSLVVDVVDGLANVPNIILTNSFDVRVFGYDGKATLHDEVFKVKPRTRPADYVYTETEARKFDELFEKAEEAVTLANELTEYVENNKLDFVDDGEGNVELKAINPEGGEGQDVDLSNYYTKEETELLIADATEGLASEEYVGDKLKAVKEIYYYEVDNILYNENDLLPVTDELIEFAQRTFAGEKVYLNVKHCAISGIAYTRVDSLTNLDVQIARSISVEPTSINSLEDIHQLASTHFFYFIIRNDPELGWTATVVRDVDDLITSKEYVDDAIAAIPTTDLSGYYTKEETTQAIQDALNAIGVAEGGAY